MVREEVRVERLLLRPMEAAEILGLGRAKIYELLREGALPSIRIGKAVRIPADRLRTWVEDQASGVSVGG